MTRLPPYLKRHAARLRTAPSASVWVAIGRGAWQWAREREQSHVGIVCPPGEDPAGFDWSPCKGHDPVLLVRAGVVDGDQAYALVVALIRDGVERVLEESGALYVVQEARHAA